ncbi:MAG: hypothetical protein EA403_06565 [Spirochaetaceae bacterium]|nr:MAG: hypothetical protein EA403_06565 [Spirochaetaceae bacterium]
MSNQVFSFSLLAAGLGMGVVFLFLGILSVLMTAIKRLFGEADSAPNSTAAAGGKKSAGGAQSGAGDQRASEGPAGSDPAGLPDWVTAAVVAFVMEEQNEFQRSASAWQPEPGRGRDAWALPGKRG